MENKLYVVTAIFNPQRYQSRIKLYNEFKKYIKNSGAELITVEAAYNNRDFTVTNEQDIQLRTNSELWHKERMINIGIQRLPNDWKYVAWIDADIIFTRPDWVCETVHLLQHYPVIQMFSHALDLGPKYEPLKQHVGVGYAHQEGMIQTGKNYEHYHPGFAWAARRDALNDLGGLFDVAILGSADRHMALSFLECANYSHPKNISSGYREQLETWQNRSKKYINKNIGYMSGTICHYWHGKKVDRRYQDRWKILIKNNYDPEFDLKFDTQGLYQFTDRNPKLEQEISKYFKVRNEDSIDLEKV